MKKWALAFIEKLKYAIERQVPVGELTDENYIIFFRQVFILVSSVLGFILCTLSLYTQKDAGALNIIGLVITDIVLVVNFLLVRKQKEKLASNLLGLGILTGFVLGIFDDYHYMSKGFIWFLIIPFVMFAIMDIKDFLKFLALNLAIFGFLQLYFYPSADEILTLHNNIKSTKYWGFLNIEYATAFFTVLIMIVTYWYVNDFLRQRFKRYREKLSQTAKLTALGEMAGNIGHEINNPLAIIKVSTDSLKRNIAKEQINKERLLDSVDSIDTTIKRISKIINSLQMISRQEDSSREMISPCEIIESVIPISNISIHYEHIKFEKKLLCGTMVHGSSVQLSQIIINLLNNAIFVVKDLKDPMINIQCMQQDDKCIIQVVDNGKGISKEHVNKIFEPFFTTKPIGKGTGLGLSLCRSMAQSMNGDIEYKRENEQTIFELWLPLNS